MIPHLYPNNSIAILQAYSKYAKGMGEATEVRNSSMGNVKKDKDE